MGPEPLWMWVAFGLFITVMLWLDLAVFNKKSHKVTIRESLGWTFAWMALAGLFMVGIYWQMGMDANAQSKALEFLTGYIIEQSLSVDNLFVIILIFEYFRVKDEYQHKVLFWGIIGALIFRILLIVAGVSLINQFSWIMYVFGGFLVITGFRMGLEGEKEIHPESNPVVRLFKKFFPVTHETHEDKFFVRIDKRWFATPLFIVVLVVEITDLVFAIDSIPAILAISRDPFIVYTSNAFAILGLRSLFFALAGLLNLLQYLKYGLSVVLMFIGSKMVLAEWVHISTGVSLLVVVSVLGISTIASLLSPARRKKKQADA
ncbi:MAG: TerC family protein [Candidatus Kapaibacterium sp.]|jgi:tellurite resistance protein TerC